MNTIKISIIGLIFLLIAGSAVTSEMIERNNQIKTINQKLEMERLASEALAVSLAKVTDQNKKNLASVSFHYRRNLSLSADVQTLQNQLRAFRGSRRSGNRRKSARNQYSVDFRQNNVAPRGEIQAYAKQRCDALFGAGHWNSLQSLWTRESGWRPWAVNSSSGACGIPQCNPCSKCTRIYADFRTNYKAQIDWGLGYIKGRYGTPNNAWSEFLRKGWY